MALVAADLTRVYRALSRWWSHVRESVAFTKGELDAAVQAVDAWADANAAEYNTALPAAFRTKATLAQKNLLLAYVCLKRAGLALAEEN